MRSYLDEADRIPNRDHKFGEILHYQPVIVLDPDGEEHVAFLTPSDIGDGIERARKNGEDVALVLEASQKHMIRQALSILAVAFGAFACGFALAALSL
jgi:nucleoside-diphosphate-sugar epimerase